MTGTRKPLFSEEDFGSPKQSPKARHGGGGGRFDTADIVKGSFAVVLLLVSALLLAWYFDWLPKFGGGEKIDPQVLEERDRQWEQQQEEERKMIEAIGEDKIWQGSS